MLGQHALQLELRRFRARRLEQGRHIVVRQQIDCDGVALAPIGRGLEDRRAAQPAMGEEQGLPKRRSIRADRGVHRYPRQRREPFKQVRRKGQRHQGRAGLGDLEPELLGQPIAQRTRAHLRDRFAAGRDHQRVRGDLAGRQPHLKSVGRALHRLDLRRKLEPHTGLAHLAGQQIDDLHRAAVAEELAQGLSRGRQCRTASTSATNMLRRAAAQRGEREFRVPREEALAGKLGRRVDVGEVAAPAARNPDLFAGRPGVVDDQHGAAALACLDRRHHAGRAGAEDQDVNRAHGPPLAYGAALFH